MAGLFKTDGLIIREVKYKESDRILTVLTGKGEKISCKAPGALKKGSKLSGPTQMLTYCDFVINDMGNFSNVTEATVKEAFTGMKSDFTAFSLGCYMAEVTNILDESGPELLSLLLNSYYVLSEHMYPETLVKAVFELRIAALAGYEPDLTCCCGCGKSDPDSPVLGIETGKICCRACRNASTGLTYPLGKEGLAAARYILAAPPKKIYPKNISEETLKLLGDASEHYLTKQADRKFTTLEYYKNIL